jgi:hypothetical protein
MASIAHWGGVLKRQVSQGNEMVLAQLSGQEVMAACQGCGHLWRDRFWTPLRTIWTFLLQVLDAGSSCRDAVAKTLVDCVVAGRGAAASPDPSAYCQARGRLPLGVLERSLRTIGGRLRDNLRQTHSWCGRNVWLVDGTSCSMPDSPQLQEAFGQPDGQAKGCGFPVATVVAMFCWASGAVLEAAIGAYRQSELALWPALRHLLSPGEIVLADRLYCTYADMAGIVARSCDCVFRLHQGRKNDFRQGNVFGPNDHLVQWIRPEQQSRRAGMTTAQWQALPPQMTIRVLRFCVDIPGFRSRVIDVATTLLDPVAYPADKIAALYRDRWLIELRFRDIKTTLGMDVLRGKTPGIVRKEIYMHLIAYNLIRTLMWQAAAKHGRNLHRLSFAGTVGRLNAAAHFFQILNDNDKAVKLYQLMSLWIANNPNPHRPNRIEPRAVKRRPKKYGLLNKPRQLMREALLS